MEQPKQSRNWIASFSGLRFLIVIMLIFHHFDMFNDLNVAGWDGIMRVLTEGYFSVSFFFILSGFVIQYGYAEKFRTETIRARDFLFNRIAHIWPVYLLCLFAALITYVGISNAFVHIGTPGFWVHFFMLQSWIPDPMFAFGYNGLAWSVSTEMFFYLMFIILVKLKRTHRDALLVGVWAVILINVMMLAYPPPPLSGWIFYINPVFRLAEFLTGMWLCDVHQKKIFAPETAKSATVMEGIGLLALICTVGIAITAPIGWQWRWQILYTIPTALLIYVFSFDGGMFSKIFGSKLFTWLGELSFPLYMVHQICLSMVKRIMLPQLTSWQALLQAGLIATGISVLVAAGIQMLFAKPLNRWLKRQWTLLWERRALKCGGKI